MHVAAHQSRNLARGEIERRILLSKVTVPAVRAFEDRLRAKGCSPVMVRIERRSLGAILADAQERNLVTRNAVREIRNSRQQGKDRNAERRRKSKLGVGIDIPTTDEIRLILRAADARRDRCRPLFVMAIFTGLRASELRGLRWADVNLETQELHVTQRADRFNEIGPPKSQAGQRIVPLPPIVVNALREWKLACPIGRLDLVFPNGIGIEEHGNNVVRGLIPALIDAGVTAPVLDSQCVPV